MLNRLAGVVNEPLSTTKNISTLVAARLPSKVAGVIFLLTATLAVQISIPNTQLEKGYVASVISNLPGLSAGVGPIKTTENKVSDNINYNVVFKEKVVASTQPTGFGALNYSDPVILDVFTTPQILKTPDGSFKYTRKLRVFATSYDPFCPGCSGWTASGLKAGYGVIAVDPNVIPLGTKVYVPGYGAAIAGDTGGSIKGAVVDLGFNNVKTDWWSARYTDLYILE